MQASNRPLKDWYGMIQRGEIKLPRFQRHEAWDRNRICSLLDTVIQELPLGITLVLAVDVGKEQFISRFLRTAPKHDGRVLEHLLDGQQRLTALWRTFHNNYKYETYFVYLKELDSYAGDKERENMTTFFRSRYFKKNGDRYPLWCDRPDQCLRRGFIPVNLLKPEEMQREIDDWIEQATAPLEPDDGKDEIRAFFAHKKAVSDCIRDARSVIANYNLPYLSLPAHTDKSVALEVFIRMNTNSKPLSQYDVIVAEVESVMGQSLHDLQAGLDARCPTVGLYSDLSDQILTTSALLQDALPNQRGAWDMDKRTMVMNWDVMESGLQRMSSFLRSEGIYDRKRLPTNAVLAVIAALYSHIPESGDQRGKNELLLKKYLWHAFFTDRYENSAATHAYADYIALKGHIRGEQKANGTAILESDVPIFGEHKFVDEEELMTAEWPNRATIRGRAILATACRLGALDFSTGEQLNPGNIERRQYHHVYPDALLKEAGISSFLALNCALIYDKTNISIGRKDPLQYLKDRYEWTSEDIVRERLQSHLIPLPELASGGYSGLEGEAKATKLERDFEHILRKRAALVMKAARLLSEGHQISASMMFNGGLPTSA